MEQDEELNGPHGDIVAGLIDLAYGVDPGRGLHLENPASPQDPESGQLLCDEDAEWILNTIEAIDTHLITQKGPYQVFCAHASIEWAERLFNLAEAIVDGDDIAFDIADRIVQELGPIFDDEDED